ncbi:MAG: cytochrome b/b6 domain-containing protein [Halodesulfurarchaeum sp.]
MGVLEDLRDRVRARTHEVDEEYSAALDADTRATRRRHGLGTRISHWLLVILFLALLVTGLMMWFGWYAPIATDLYDGYYPAFGIHMWAGILVLSVGFVLFPFFHVFVDGHNPLPTKQDVIDTLTIVAAFVGLREYVAGYHRARRTFDDREDEWAAYHPAQKLFWWTQLVLFALLAFTGFAMYDRMATDPAAWIGWLGAPAAWLAPETQLQVHIFLALALTAAVMMHIYFAVLPSNWDVLTSMVTGDVDAYVIEADTPPTVGDDDD